MNEAYKKRDLEGIKKRLKSHTRFIQFQRKLIKNKNYNIEIENILIYPIVESVDTLSDIINRISCSLPQKDGLNIFIAVSDNLKNINITELPTPKYQARYIGKNKNIHIINHTLIKEHLETDYILVHDVRALNKLSLLKKAYKIKIIDKEYFSDQETENLRSLFFNCLKDEEKSNYLDISKKNYFNMIEKNRGKKNAYCFTTGPSFDNYKSIKIKKDSFKIICNSIVKNSDFIDYVKGVDLLTFADPVFHFGPSTYTEKFINDVISLVNKYDTYIIVPENSMAILLSHYSQLKNNLIGMPIGNRLNTPSIDNFFLKGSANILTLFMIPLATAVAKTTFIIGADGRRKEEKYFWKHSNVVQYSDEMESTFITHPSFFRDRNYADYYFVHCEFLEKLLRYGESRNHFYFSVTKSFIPALEKRQYKNIFLIKVKRFLINTIKESWIYAQYKKRK